MTSYLLFRPPCGVDRL